MKFEKKIKQLSVPKGNIDVVLDTDAYNEIDDQYAISYLLLSKEKLTTKAIYAAPFLNKRVSSPAEGMEKSYNEVSKILNLMRENVSIYKGSTKYLPDEKTPVLSEAAKDLAERVENYSTDKPLYILAIGAITNIASAILLNPKVAENAVVVWLGGHAIHYRDTNEFNMYQDIAAVRVVMKSGIPLVQLPCQGVVSSFTISGPELDYYLKGKNELTDYLVKNTIEEVESYAKGKAWSRCIWDVAAVAWLLNDNDKFMLSRIVPAWMPTYDNYYSVQNDAQPMRYVYHIFRDELVNDLFEKLKKA